MVLVGVFRRGLGLDEVMRVKAPYGTDDLLKRGRNRRHLPLPPPHACTRQTHVTTYPHQAWPGWRPDLRLPDSRTMRYKHQPFKPCPWQFVTAHKLPKTRGKPRGPGTIATASTLTLREQQAPHSSSAATAHGFVQKERPCK